MIGSVYCLIGFCRLRSSLVLSLPSVTGIEVEGGPPLIVLTGIVTFLVASVLAVIVTYRFLEGYRQTGSRPVLWLAIGMFFLAPAPMFIRVLTANVDTIPLPVRMLGASFSELTGLLVILYVIYTR